MAKYKSFYKVVQPRPEVEKMIDNQDISGSGEYGNYTWYQRLVQGSATRLTRYKEYELMDNDVEVSRALDIIAEEMTGNNSRTDLPLEVDIQEAEGQPIPKTTVLTLRAALRHWSDIHDWHTRLFKIARNLAMYGDIFFKKDGDFKKWIYVHPKRVVAALVDKDDVTKVIGWQIKTGTKKAFPGGGKPVGAAASALYETEVVSATEMVRFSLNDDMSDTAPFGDSILRTVFRAHRQKELMEDAIIIYRVQRAPERRVFYIDVGKMAPQRTKQYLEQMKNEIRQKKIPTTVNGKDQVDSVYNPQSMSEDFFFAQRPDGRGSRVETLPGGQNLGELTDLEYFQDKVWRGLRVPVNWMKYGAQQGAGAVFNDGRVGTAYVEELRFCLFVQRLQGYVETILDHEFKRFLRNSNINIDPTMYKIRLPEPQNFALYKQVELDSQLLGALSSADQVQYLSKRFVLSRYLGLEEDEIAINEKMLREEKGLNPTGGHEDLPQLYGSPDEMGMGGAGGMGGTGLGGAGMGGEMVAGGEGEMGAEGAEGAAGEMTAGGAEAGGTPPTGAAPGGTP